MSTYAESLPNPTLDRAEDLEAELLELTAHIHAGEFRQLEVEESQTSGLLKDCSVR